MGIPEMTRWQVVALVAVLCASAQSFEEVGEHEASLHDAVGDDSLEAAAQRALREHGEIMMQIGGTEASPAVLALTHKSKKLAGEIDGIHKQKKLLKATMRATHEKATFSGNGDSAMKSHINAGAKDKDLDAALHQKNTELATVTREQHAAAKAAAMGKPHTPWGAQNQKGGFSAGGSFGGGFHAGGAIGSDHTSLFDNWLSKYSTMKSNLKKMVEELSAHTTKLRAEVMRQHTEVTNHMGVVKKAYVTVSKKEAAAKAAEKATKERMAKAVKEKTSKVQTGAKKEEIKRLKALNAKIKADCERNMKEKTQKINTMRQQIAKLSKEVTRLRQQVAQLTKALEAQKRETAKQTALKISHEKARKAAEQKLRAALARIQVLTQKLNKLRSIMKHINNKSNIPDKK